MIQAYGTGRWLLVVSYASKKSAFEILNKEGTHSFLTYFNEVAVLCLRTCICRNAHRAIMIWEAFGYLISALASNNLYYNPYRGFFKFPHGGDAKNKERGMKKRKYG